MTSIGDNAFSGCASLDHVLLPDNITDIGDDAFGADVKLYCTLSSTTADTLLDHGYTAYYADEASGLIYKRSGSELTVTGYTRNVEELSIPAQVSGLPVTAIDERAFGGMVTPKSLVIADSVTTIGAYAFYDCFRLESVKLPAGLTTVGAYAFDCFSYLDLRVFDLPDGITSIGEMAFGSDTDNIAFCCTIGSSTAAALEMAGYTPSFRDEADYVFAVNDSGNLTLMGYLGSETVLNVPASVNGLSVTAVGDCAFEYCETLKGITLPGASPALATLLLIAALH